MEKKAKNTIDDYDYLASAASMQDCTGLIPANPYPEAMDAYEDVFHYEPPKIKVERQ